MAKSRKLKEHAEHRYYSFFYSDVARKSVRVEAIHAKRDTLMAQGLDWERAWNIALDPDTYPVSDDAVREWDRHYSRPLPDISLSEVWHITQIVEDAHRAGMEAYGIAQETGGDYLPTQPTPESIRDSFDAKWNSYFDGTNKYADPEKDRYTDDRMFARRLWECGYVLGWRQAWNVASAKMNGQSEGRSEMIRMQTWGNPPK